MGKLIADKAFNNYNKKNLRKRYMMLFDITFIKISLYFFKL